MSTLRLPVELAHRATAGLDARIRRWSLGLLTGAALLALVTAVIALLEPHVPVLSLGVLYLFAVLPVAVFWGLPLAIAASVASMLAFNFYFLPPTHTFTLQDSRTLEAVEHATLRAGLPVDARVETGRTPTHALQRLWDAERFDRIVAPAPINGSHGFTPKELQWILVHAPYETLILRPDPTLAEGLRLAGSLDAVA